MSILRVTFFASAVCASLTAPTLSQCEIAQFSASDAASHDEFGTSVAYNRDTIFIGAGRDDYAGMGAGSVYIFTFGPLGWAQSGQLTASDAAPGDWFGRSICIQGDVALIGAPANDGLGEDSGSVYVFERVGFGWTEQAELTASDGAAGDEFGWSISMTPDRALIGAPYDDDFGSVYVFDIGPNGWTETEKLTANDPSLDAAFGDSVALDGSRALIGSYSDDDLGLRSGSAYIFDFVNSTWGQSRKLLPADGTTSLRFGVSVDVAGNRAIIGSGDRDDQGPDPGAAYVFELVGTDWVESAKLCSSDTSGNFGSAVALVGNRAFVGANSEVHTEALPGAVYIFESQSSGWQQTGKLVADDATAWDYFGTSLAVSGGRILIGAPQSNRAAPAAGAAYFYSVPAFARAYGFCESGSPCGNTEAISGCLNSTGRGGLLTACGTTSVASDDLHLRGLNLPPQSTAIVFMGGGRAQAPLGDGLRQVASGGLGTFRYPTFTAGSTGAIVVGPGIVNYSLTHLRTAGHIGAGQTWNFQCWYRDPGGPCQSGSNTTNAIEITFTP